MFERIRNLKIILIVVAIIIAIASLLTSNYLTHDLQGEEKNKMEVWAEAMRSLNSADENTDLNLVLKVINGNNTIPVIVLDKFGNVQTHRNLGITFKENQDSISILQAKAKSMQNEGNSIRIFIATPSEDDIMFEETDELTNQYMDSADKNSDSFTVIHPETKQSDADYIEICYGESLMLKRLAVYPYIQLSVVVIFVLIAIFALFSSMKAEQNKVWVGLSKETAHQLGTPISSLMAWSEVLKETYPDDELLPEMDRVVEYMDKRTSNKVHITSHLPSDPVIVNLVASLFEWVAENLCKNAVDAMSGSGSIDIYMEETDNIIALEFKDTGKGIAKSQFSSVFKPGFTTKKRGWGLGLSLAKRIVEEYHKGRIFVKSSEIGKGTTFRVELPK